MKRRARFSCKCQIGLALFFVLTSGLALANEAEQQLRSQYRGKILLLRSFHSGNKLVYDSGGSLTSGNFGGDWTTDGFVKIDDIHLSGQDLKIKAMRLMVVSSRSGFQFAGQSMSKKQKKPKKSEIVEIDAVIGSDAVSDGAANALLSKVFLSSQDRFADVVPGYWRPCIHEGISGKNENCRFSSEILEVPGVMTPSRNPTTVSNAGTTKDAQGGPNATTTSPATISQVGHGVKPPRATYQPEPSFSEPARKAKYQGVVTMGLIVDRDGLPQNIHILNPVGAGLDAKAVEAVSTWKFKPAEKDGQPVAVQIAVEVDFHLY